MNQAAHPVVDCPGCRGPSPYYSGNPYRPFCSARCRQIDLGLWASEQFRVPEKAPGTGADGLSAD